MFEGHYKLESKSKSFRINKQKDIVVNVIDTLAHDEDAAERRDQYLDADCFMICVAADSASPCESVRKWNQEIRSVMDDATDRKYIIMLALTKSDLIEEGNARVQESDLEELAR
mgnify:CR=1 FL=1